jgi:flagellar hook-associated protein 2
MATITSSGTGSGLDIAGIVDQLVNAERAPVASRLTAKESKANELLSALGKFRSSLASFQDSLKGLKDVNTFQGRKVTTGDDKVFTATANSSSRPGSYSVEVTALATAHRLSAAARPDATSAIGTGIISITVNGLTSNIAIDGTANSLNDIRNAINAAPDNPGVRATIVTGADGAHLVLSATKTGLANAMTVAVSGGDGGLSPFAYTAGGPSNTMTSWQRRCRCHHRRRRRQQCDQHHQRCGPVTLTWSAQTRHRLTLGIDYDTDGAKRPWQLRQQLQQAD